MVHHYRNDELPYSNYFADLIVSDQNVITGSLPIALDAIQRHLKPLGGMIVVRDSEPASHVATHDWFTKLGFDPTQPENRKTWTRLVREALPGAGNWSRQYGNPANTAIGGDTRVKGDLSVLWYGDPGPGDMVNRHDGAIDNYPPTVVYLFKGTPRFLRTMHTTGPFCGSTAIPQRFARVCFKIRIQPI